MYIITDIAMMLYAIIEIVCVQKMLADMNCVFWCVFCHSLQFVLSKLSLGNS